MFRYVGLIWNPTDHNATAAARLVTQRLRSTSAEWSCAQDSSGLIVFHADMRLGSSDVYTLPSGAGVLLGKLFKKDFGQSAGSTSVVPGATETLTILGSGGRHLIECYWGRFVAFVHDAGVGRTWILRDPVGALPCYVTAFRGVRIFFSHIEDCASLDLLQFSINWRYVAAFVCYSMVQTADTGLNEVSEVQPGECLEICADGAIKRMLYWDPVGIAQSDLIENGDEAVEALHNTTKACIWAWASCYPRIVHLLSGGLDSSIVLSCLETAPTRPIVTCLNYFDPASPASDERAFAREAASLGQSELIECEEQASAVKLQAVLDVSKSAKPWLSEYYIRHGRIESQLAKERRATAIFQGAGGDQIFYQSPVILAAGDYLYQHGLQGRFFRIVLDLARMQRRSVWSVLSAAVRDGFLRPQWDPLSLVGSNSRLVSRQVIEAVRRDDAFVHPWLRNREGVPKGKLWHIWVMSVSHDFYDPLALPDDPERVRPLVSQPLLELCLRIPTYILTAGGWDRGALRLAFAHNVPAAIISRRGKGTIDRYLQQLLEQNLDFVQEMLLDGYLVQQGLLDRRKLENALVGSSVGRSGEALEVLAYHLCTEAWLRSWDVSRRRAAA